MTAAAGVANTAPNPLLDRHVDTAAIRALYFDAGNHFTLLVALTDIGMDAERIECVRGSHPPLDGFDRDIPRHFLEVPG